MVSKPLLILRYLSTAEKLPKSVMAKAEQTEDTARNLIEVNLAFT